MSADPRAERLEEILEGGAGPARQASDPDLASLAALGAHLAVVLPTQAPPAFRARLQAELQRSAPSARRPRARALVPRLAGLLAAVVLMAATAVVASASSLPGDALYPVKRVVEDARIALARSGAARVSLYLSLSDVRLSEIDRLVDMGLMPPAGVIEDLLAAQLAARAAVPPSDPVLAARADTSATRTAAALRDLATRLDGDAQRTVESAADALDAGRTRVEPPPALVEQPAWPPSSVVATASRTATPTSSATPRPSLPAEVPARGLPETAAPPRVESPTAPPAVPSAVPSTAVPPVPAEEPTRAPAGPPTAVAQPSPTALPSDTPAPTLDRAEQRNATLTAEARPTVAPPPTGVPPHRPRWTPPRRSHELPPPATAEPSATPD